MRFLLLTGLFFSSCSALGQYNFYFGNIHSHTSYSDGNKDSIATGYYYPGQDYNYAKGSFHMDFLGISDHNHYSSNNNPGMHVADYPRGLYQSDTANQEGTFVCLYGYEWGVISSGGHIVTYGVPGLIGWETGSGGWGPTNNYDIYCWKLDFAGYWSTVNAYPNSFCTLAHPQTGDYSDLAGAAPYSASADTAIAGIAIRSGSATSTTSNYGDPAPTLYESVYLKALAKGYHLGPTADQDNHYTNFGRNNRIRTVVLATQLKRDSILAAYRAMRFYASDDWNTEVTFTVNGHYMGSDFSTNSNSSVFVSVNDPDAPGDPNDNISKIELFYGTPGSNINATLLTSNTNSTTLSFNHPTIATNNYYYFAKITQADGDMMWTAPIWVYRSTVPLPLDLTRFSAVADQGQVRLNWTTAQEINLDRFEIERSTDGSFFQQIGFVPSRHHSTSLPTDYDFYDAAPNHSINFYRLKQIGQDGNYRYSDVVAVRFSKPLISIVSINPNPVINWLNIKCVALESIQVTARIFNSTGRQVYQFNEALSAGTNYLSRDLSILPAGTYFLELSKPDIRIAETRFILQ